MTSLFTKADLSPECTSHSNNVMECVINIYMNAKQQEHLNYSMEIFLLQILAVNELDKLICVKNLSLQVVILMLRENIHNCIATNETCIYLAFNHIY